MKDGYLVCPDSCSSLILQQSHNRAFHLVATVMFVYWHRIPSWKCDHYYENATTTTLVFKLEPAPLENKLKYKFGTPQSLQVTKERVIYSNPLKYLKTQYLIPFTVSIVFSCVMKSVLANSLIIYKLYFIKNMVGNFSILPF